MCSSFILVWLDVTFCYMAIGLLPGFLIANVHIFINFSTFSSLSTVCCYVCCIRQVPPERCGGGHVLRADCAVGQQEQQEDPSAEDSAVSSSTHGTVNTWHSEFVLYFNIAEDEKRNPCCLCSTQCTVWMLSAPRMPTTWSASPPMARCAPGAWTCSLSHR